MFMFSVCAGSVECAEPAAETLSSSVINFRAGNKAGADAFSRDYTSTNLGNISRSMGLAMVRGLGPKLEPYTDTLASAWRERMRTSMSDPATFKVMMELKVYEVESADSQIFMDAYQSAYKDKFAGFILGYSEGYGILMLAEKNLSIRDQMKQNACDLSIRLAKDVFFEMNQKPKSKK